LGTNRQAAKRNRQSKQFRLRNRAFKTQIKNTIRKFEIESDISKKTELLKSAFSILDKAGQKHIIHHRKADRQKSILTKRLNKFRSQSTAVGE